MRPIDDLTDFAACVIESMDSAAFPTAVVLAILGPAVEASMSSYGRIDLRTADVEAIAPDCGRDGVEFALDWWRARPTAGAATASAMRRGSSVVTGPSLAGGTAAWQRDANRELIKILGGCDHLAMVPLALDPLELSWLSFSRPRRDFTPAELGLLASVQPLLRAVARHAVHMARWSAQFDGRSGQACAAADEVGLTPREITVLHLVAQGLTATSISRRLGCSPRTVEKHVANIYRKLEVGDRVTAVLRAQERHLLAPPPAGTTAAPADSAAAGMAPVR